MNRSREFLCGKLACAISLNSQIVTYCYEALPQRCSSCPKVPSPAPRPEQDHPHVECGAKCFISDRPNKRGDIFTTAIREKLWKTPPRQHPEQRPQQLVNLSEYGLASSRIKLELGRRRPAPGLAGARRRALQMLADGIKSGEFRKVNVDETASFISTYLDGVFARAMILKDFNPIQSIRELRAFLRAYLN
ncbi:protein of unknown function [Hyphomicrobium sp. MC1]|nr:protein of unknown function [Hyphomicrobium sp. MC1]